jgi:hypothetical protein
MPVLIGVARCPLSRYLYRNALMSLLSVLQVPVGNFLPASGSGTVFFNEVPGTVQRTIQYNRKHRARILKCFLSAGARAL